MLRAFGAEAFTVAPESEPESQGGHEEAFPPPLPAAQPVQKAAVMDGAEIRTLPLTVSAASPLLPFDGTANYAAEEYKIIRTRLVQHPYRPRLIMVSSAGPADGKTVTAINLAASLSLKNPARVLLIDGDLRRPSVNASLGLPMTPGLTDLLSGECAFEEAVIRAGQFPNLYVLPRGTARSDAVELLDSERWVKLCESARRDFGYVIIDSTPVAAVADYHLLQASCDGVVLVVRPDHTRRKLFFNALDIVRKEKLLGIVMNYVEKWFMFEGHSTGYYSEYYSEPDRKTSR
jgi:receptor protein-tyrosine kinase